MRLPTQGRWQVKHGRDYLADLVRTRNLSFDQEGFISLARKPISVYGSDTDSNFGQIVAIVPNDSSSLYYILTDAGDYSFTPSTGAVAALNNSHVTSAQGNDAVLYNALLCATTTTKLQSYNGTVWTDRVTGLSSSYPHPLAVFEDRVEISIGNGNAVQNYNTSWSAQNTLTIPAQYVVTCLRWRAGRMYIGTRHIYGGEAKMFIWDGVGTSTQPGYGVGAAAIYSMEEFQSSMAVVTSAGQLIRFNGGGFDELAHFPIYDTQYAWLPEKIISASSFDRIPNRGMCRVGNRLYINIKGDIEAALDISHHHMPSGIWVYDPAVGLYHRSGHQQNTYTTLTITALSSNTLTVGTHGLTTGDPVFASSVSNITGLTANNIYYAIVMSTTTIKLALSRVNAVNSVNLTLSGTPSGDTLKVDSTNSFGAVFDTTPGAIAPLNSQSVNSFFSNGLIFGCQPFNNTATSRRFLNVLGLHANRGYFVTTPIPASGINDFFQKLFLEVQGLNTTSDQIVVKYRIKERFGYPGRIRVTTAGMGTWASTTMFTVDTTKKDVGAVQVGDEVEIVSGSASGYCTKVTAIDTSTSTYTFTVADTMPVSVSDKSEVMFENWTLLGTYDMNTPNVSKGFLEVPVGGRNTQIQFKVELRGYDVKLRSLNAVNKVDKPVA